MTDNDAREVPFDEQLRTVPKDFRATFAIQWAADGTETGHRFIPIGYMAHKAADTILALRKRVGELERENAAAINWNHSVRVCKEHTTDIVDGEGCVVCDAERAEARVKELTEKNIKLRFEVNDAFSAMAAAKKGHLDMAKVAESRSAWAKKAETALSEAIGHADAMHSVGHTGMIGTVTWEAYRQWKEGQHEK